ncbi:MAG: hypothetical protein O3C60_10170 [Planctomycetota bacterium]|nr:hypothetical protein [Planctomycetota bacterium]
MATIFASITPTATSDRQIHAMNLPAKNSWDSRTPVRGGRHRVPRIWSLAVLIVLSGCVSSDWIRLRQIPNNPLAQPLQLLSWKGPQATPRTSQLLRRYNLQEELVKDPQELLQDLQEIVVKEPSSEHVYALAELCYINGKRAEQNGSREEALDMYGAAVGNAYIFLLDERLDLERNPYDPQFRRACDLYNGALESVLRMICKNGNLQLEGRIPVKTATQSFDIKVVARGNRNVSDFEHFRFVSDYELQGLTNVYQTYGLGVPLIGVYGQKQQHDAGAEFYPQGISCPVTVFLRVLPCENGCVDAAQRDHHCVLEIYDSGRETETFVNHRRVPLETDISTPLAYALKNPFFKEAENVTRGLLNSKSSQTVAGIYMLEPYDPDKIPVLMVHGLWSGLTTWMEMFNDLRGSDRIRQNYQFWFYQYPTGQSFWISAAHLRSQLERIRSTVDPNRQSTNLDKMVVVAHSMGGLVAEMQVIDSGDHFWNLVSDYSIQEVDVPPEVLAYLRNTLYFTANPSIQRIVTIATPHGGSTLSNSATQWLGRRVIMPPLEHEQARKILRQQDDVLKSPNLLDARTSIEAMAPDCVILPTLQNARSNSRIAIHNIVGRTQEKGVLGRVTGDGDGVVSFENAHLDDAASELVVAADHIDIHRHPKTVLEVRRILLEHLDSRNRPLPHRLPSVVTASGRANDSSGNSTR